VDVKPFGSDPTDVVLGESRSAGRARGRRGGGHDAERFRKRSLLTAAPRKFGSSFAS
jgi:hypothetical protein